MYQRIFHKIREKITVAVVVLGLLTSSAFFGEPAYAGASGLTVSSGNSQYYTGGPAVTVDNLIGLSGFGNITGAKVAVRNLKTGDQLNFVNNYGITGSYDADTGILSLSGTTTGANYRSALRTVTFSTTSTNTADRIIDFSIGSGLYNPDNGHFYEFVSAPDITWDNAITSSSAMALYGRTGYLVTITSAAENAFVTDKVEGLGWIGAKDIHYVNTSSIPAYGDWRWVTGPEGLADGGNGTQFFTGYAIASPVAIGYENWWSGEPNNGDRKEHVAHIFGPVDTMPAWAKGANAAQPGEWNDFEPVRTDGAVKGFIVEYGGMGGEDPLSLQGSKMIELSDPTPIAIMAESGGFSSGNVGGDSDKTLLWKKGYADTMGGDVVLTNSGNQAGSIIRRNQIKLNDGFSTYFQMYFSGDADGIVFIVYKADTPKLGDFAGALGYGDLPSTSGDNSIHDSIAVEFDTWDNCGDGDSYDSATPDATMDNHVAIMLDGNAYHDTQSAQAIQKRASLSGQTINAWVDYDAGSNTITATYGTGSTKGDLANETITRALSGADQIPRADDNVFVGFTSSTGGNNTTHKLLKWYFKDSYVADGLDPSEGAYAQAPSSIELTPSVATDPDTVTIVTLDAAGNEMENQTVQLYMDGTSIGSFNTGADGYAYGTSGLAAGSHTLRAVALGGASNYTTFNMSEDSSSDSGGHHYKGGGKDSANQPIAEVNGQPTVSGTSNETTSSDGKTITNITVNQTSLENQLKDKAAGATVTIPFTKSTDIAVGELNGQMVKDMEGKEATLVIETPTASYTLPAEQIDIDAISASLGSNAALSDIKVQITIAAPPNATVQVVQQAADKNDLTLVVPAVDFEVSCLYNGKTVNVSKFNAFVERRVMIPTGADPQKITTAVVVDPDGKTRHVPTKVVLENGAYYAVINSMTNSTYSVVWHPFEFADAASCWARDSINNMGSRMVVSGVDGSNYEPNRNMTRSEFAAIVVKALGLVPGDGSMTFSDIAASDWYSDYVKTAASYGIISGYGDGNFGPNDTITREQAMTMIARAMSLTSLKETVNDTTVLAKFTDNAEISAYADSSIARCVTAGVVSGKTETTIAPKAEITRAEVAAIVERMLKKADLID